MDERAVVTLLEAIYALELDDETWLSQTLVATKSLFGEGRSYLGYFYDASDLKAFNVWNVRVVDQPPEVDEAFRTSQLTVSPALLRATLRKHHVGSIRRTGMPHVSPLFEARERVGWGDIFSVNGLDPSGIGCMLTIGTREKEFVAGDPEMSTYARIAQHLAAAFRCRRALGKSQKPGEAASQSPPQAEAIMDEDGRFVHAEGEAAGKIARERLRAAASSMSTVRVQARKSGRAELDGWSPLVDARWTLVDSFEENGRHYVVARENQARGAHLDVLTDRERQVVLQAALGFTNKEIAYALGLSDSTVRVLMARAAARVGVRTRAELLSHPLLKDVSDERERP